MTKPKIAIVHPRLRSRGSHTQTVVKFCAVLLGLAIGAPVFGAASLQNAKAAARASVRATNDFAGLTLDVRLKSCIVSLPATGGICDARNDAGSRVIASTVTIPANVTVLLGAGDYKSQVLPAFRLAGSASSLKGMSRITTHLVANLRSGALIEGPAKGASNQRVENLTLDDTSPENAGSVGIEWRNETGGLIRNVHVRKVETGLVMEGVPKRSGCYYNEIENFSAYDYSIGVHLGAHAVSNTFIDLFLDMGRRAGIAADVSAGANIFVKPDVEVQPRGAAETAYMINSGANTLLQPYVEAVSTGFELGPHATENIILGGAQASLKTGVINHASRWANIIINPNMGYPNGLRVYGLDVASASAGSKLRGFDTRMAVRNSKDTDFGPLEANFWVPGSAKGAAVGKITYGGSTATFQIPNSGVAINSTHQFVINDLAQTLSHKTLEQPRLAASTFAGLPKEVNGMMIYCPDCIKATPCRGGGKGAIAKGIAGKWDCN